MRNKSVCCTAGANSPASTHSLLPEPDIAVYFSLGSLLLIIAQMLLSTQRAKILYRGA